MAWALQLDGNLQMLLLASDIDLNDFELTVENLKQENTTASGEFQTISGDRDEYNWFISTRDTHWYIRISNSNYTIPFTTVKEPTARGTLTVSRTGNKLTFSFDGDSTTITVTAAAMRFGCFGMINYSAPASGHSFGGEIGNITLTNGATPINLWNFDNSDHSGTDPQPVAVDTIGGNSATGVNFPANDPSVWINLGGGSSTNPFWAKPNQIIY